MKEKIKGILAELEIDNVDEVVDNIAKEVALHTVPKDKYNDVSNRLKNVESEKSTIETELEDLKNKNLTDEQKLAKDQADLEKKTKELNKELNKLKAKDIFKNANIADDKIEELLGKVVSDDEKTTLDLANSFADILKTNTEAAKAQASADLLTSTPKPSVKADSSNSKTYTKEDFIKMSFQEKKDLFATDAEQYNSLVAQMNK